jgi:putative acetyltransferase
MTRPQVVAYRLSDQQAVEAFFAEVWQGSRFPFDPERAHSDLRRIPAEYQANGGGFWLMRLSKVITGTVAVCRRPDNVAEVKRLNVMRQHRGRGLGERLLPWHTPSPLAMTPSGSIRFETAVPLSVFLRRPVSLRSLATTTIQTRICSWNSTYGTARLGQDICVASFSRAPSVPWRSCATTVHP